MHHTLHHLSPKASEAGAELRMTRGAPSVVTLLRSMGVRGEPETPSVSAALKLAGRAV